MKVHCPPCCGLFLAATPMCDCMAGSAAAGGSPLAQLRLEGGRLLKAKLVVGADGGRSQVSASQGMSDLAHAPSSPFRSKSSMSMQIEGKTRKERIGW